MKRKVLTFIIIIISVTFWGGVARGAWTPAHLIGNLPGIQMFGDVTYNWMNDEFFVTYHGHAVDTGNAINPINREPWADEEFAKACGAVVRPDGLVEYSITLANGDPENVYNLSAVDYNLNANSYLVTLRHDEPSKMDMQYLDANGATVAGPIRLSDKAGAQQIEYNLNDDRFLVRWNWTPSKDVWSNNYLMVSGQPSSDPFLTQQVEISPAVLGNVSYNWTTNTFLFVYAAAGDVYGRILNSNGNVIREMPIDAGPRGQSNPHAAYSRSTNQWLVAYAHHSGRQGVSTWFDIHAAFVDSNGGVVRKFIIKNSEDWEALGPIAYDPTTDRFYVTWREANDIWMVAVNPHTAAVEEVIPGDEILAPVIRNPPLGAMVRGIAIRVHREEPKALVIWTDGYGLTGMRGTIVSLIDGKQTALRGGGDGCLDAPPPGRVIVPPTVEPTPIPTQTPTPISPSPTPASELKIEKFVRNISKGQTASRKELLSVSQFDILQFITLITSLTDHTITGLVVRDQLPADMTFIENSTLVDGRGVSGDEVIQDGLAIGSIQAGASRTVRWSAQVNALGTLSRGVNVSEFPVVVTTDDTTQAVQDDLQDTTQTGTTGDATSGAALPSTGPAGTVLLALVGAALASLAYAGYTRSDRFHRNQVEDVVSQREPMDFRG